MKKSLVFFLALSLLCSPVFSVHAAEDPILRIQAFPDQNSATVGMMFLVRVEVKNASSDSSTEFWSNSCSYEKHWVTDPSAVLIQSWTCAENTLEQVSLDPGSSYEKNIILYVPKMEKSGPMIFRLGFKRMSENGDVAEPLWSDPVTIHVTVPEGMEEAADAEPAEAAAPFDSDAMPEGAVTERPEASEPESAASVASQPLTFQDPGVPINVGPGQEFLISLASNPSTGFRWKMTLPANDQTVLFLGSDHVVSQDVMPGVPGEEVFKFKALTQGKTTAAFVYERPWETKTAPVRKIFTIVVQAN